MYFCVIWFECVLVCVCVCERDIVGICVYETVSERQRFCVECVFERRRGRESVGICVCVLVCLRDGSVTDTCV